MEKEIAKCPYQHCGSTDWEPIEGYDYIKQCKKCGLNYISSPLNYPEKKDKKKDESSCNDYVI